MKAMGWWLAAGMAVLLAAGCAPGPGTAREGGGGAQPPSSPKEQLDEARMEQATRGLIIRDDAIRVQTTRRDAATGERLREKAERVMVVENACFLAVGAFRDALMADPTNAKTFEGLARAFLMEGKTDEATPALLSAIKLNPKLSSARYELGLVRQMDGDYAEAVQDWRELVAYDPGFRDVYARMAIASYYAQDYGSAWAYLADADKRHQAVPPQFRPLLKEVAARP